ncbi:MAG: hypothetical protein WCO50_07350, partial [Synechococcus sp. ELA619]
MVALLRAREFGRAARLLASDTDVAPAGEATFAALLALHPPPASPDPPHLAAAALVGAPAQLPPVKLTSASVAYCLSTAPKLSAGGPTGWVADVIRRPILESTALLDAYTGVLNLFVSGQMDAATCAALVACNLIGIDKPGGKGVRPIGMGDVMIRKTATRAAVHQVVEAAADFFAPLQLGIGVSGGVETTARGMQVALEAHPEWGSATYDARNAFNEMSRPAARRKLLTSAGGRFSCLVPLFDVLYGAPNRLWVRMESWAEARSFFASGGTTQGCALAGLVFDLTMQDSLVRVNAFIQARGGGLVAAVQDDAHLAAAPAVLGEAHRRLQAWLAEDAGLTCRPEKTRVLSLGCAVDPAAMGVALGLPAGAPPLLCLDVATPAAERGLVMVGVPVGTPEYIVAECGRRIEHLCSHVPDRIATYLRGHFSEAVTALRLCAGPAAMFLSRAVAPAHMGAAARVLDDAVVTAASALLRANGAIAPGSATHLQMQLPLGRGMGGLGLTSLELVGPCAHVASVVASVPLLATMRPELAAPFRFPLPVDARELLPPAPPSAGSPPPLPLPPPGGAPLPSVAAFRATLAALPVASYRLLRDAEASAAARAARAGARPGSVGAPRTEQSDDRGLQHRLTGPVTDLAQAAFLRQLEAECAGDPDLHVLALAQYRSFCGGGGLFLVTGGGGAILDWEARLFIRSVLRILPEEMQAGWASDGVMRTGLRALAAASAAGRSARHTDYSRHGLAVLAAFPGTPRIRTEVAGCPGPGDRMDAVVEGALVAPPPAASARARRAAGAAGPLALIMAQYAQSSVSYSLSALRVVVRVASGGLWVCL